MAPETHNVSSKRLDLPAHRREDGKLVVPGLTIGGPDLSSGQKPHQDRTVHARWAQMEVVRYDKAGKWYLEPVGGVSPRQHVTVEKAAEYAVWALRERDGYFYLDQPGGNRFDLLVDRMVNNGA